MFILTSTVPEIDLQEKVEKIQYLLAINLLCSMVSLNPVIDFAHFKH